MNVLDLATKRVILKKASSTNGGEWQGPCPGCGGTDRFHVWPVQNEGKGGYWCRGCGRTGDNIQFLRDFEGLSFRDACARLSIALPDRPRSRGDRPAPHAAPEFKPERRIPPADLWQEKAEKFIAWAQNNLVKNTQEGLLIKNPEILAWLAGRGISAETAANFRLGWNPGEDGHDIYRPRKSWGLPELLKDDGRPKALWIPRGLVIPYIVDGVIYRIRIRRPEGEPRYYVLPGSSMAVMIIGRDRRAFVVVEAELDAIAVAASTPFLAGSVALGSVSAKPDADTYAILQGALQILNALDYDLAGARAMEWWSEHFDHCDRWPTPAGKDPGEAFKLGIDLKKWIEAGLPPALTIGTPQTVGIQKVGSSVTPLEKTVSPALRWGPQGNSPIPERANSDGRVSHQNAANYQPSTNETPGAPAEKMLDRDAPAIPVEIQELLYLLKKYPDVKIINTPVRYTVLRDGKWVGGRINELVFRVPEVTDYLMNHPAAEIDGSNLLVLGEERIER